MIFLLFETDRLISVFLLSLKIVRIRTDDIKICKFTTFVIFNIKNIFFKSGII